ncbi:MAG: hypothetical protein ACSLFQ_11735 [Thermoanaerobaculia bacterium]
MKVEESIRLWELSRPADWYVSIVSESGYRARHVGESVILEAPYEPNRFERLGSLLESEAPLTRMSRSVWADWEEEDFRHSELLVLSFPKLEIDGFYEDIKCSHCERGTAPRDYGRRVRSLNTRHKVAIAGIWAVVVHRSVKERAGADLHGFTFVPFDEAGEYFYLKAAGEIQQQRIGLKDGINIREACPVCGRYQYDVFVGPLRYRREGWNGDDVVYSYFNDTFLFTPRAYELLRSFESGVERAEPVYLE